MYPYINSGLNLFLNCIIKIRISERVIILRNFKSLSRDSVLNNFQIENTQELLYAMSRVVEIVKISF